MKIKLFLFNVHTSHYDERDGGEITSVSTLGPPHPVWELPVLKIDCIKFYPGFGSAAYELHVFCAPVPSVSETKGIRLVEVPPPGKPDSTEARPGIDLGDGNFSGCSGSGGDCPRCGH